MQNIDTIETEIRNALTRDLKDFDVQYYIEDGFDHFEDSILEWINTQDIIYYSNAIKYLLENDQSLSNSIELAIELGYGIASINSELLATLLYQQELNELWSDCRNEIEEIFDNIIITEEEI